MCATGATVKETRACTKCEQVLPLDSFYKCAARKDGLQSYCKDCVNLHRRQYRQRHPEKVRMAENKRRAENLDKRKAIERRAGAKRRNKPGVAQELREKASLRNKIAYYKSNPKKTCDICGVEFCNLFSRQSNTTVCSDECKRKKRLIGKVRKEKARKIRKRGIGCEVIDLMSVLERDGWRCQICGIDTPKQLRGSCEDRAPEVDHIIPLAKGGLHTYQNVQCACRKCNREKWDYLPIDPQHPANR